jgi:hypothetical protein
VFNAVSTSDMKASFNTSSNKFFVLYYSGSSLKARTGTISGSTISFSSEISYSITSFSGSVSIIYVPTLNVHYASFRADSKVRIIRLQIISGLPVFGTDAIVSAGDTSLVTSVTYHAIENQIIVSYRNDASSNRTALTVLNATGTNLSATSFVGFSNGSYSDAATATIQTVGSVNNDQTGLTAGSVYYVQPNGTLSTTVGTPKVTAGIATSATELLIAELITPPALSTWELISSVSASSSATIDITSGFDSTYNTYAIVITNVLPSSSSQFQLQTQRSGSFADTELAMHRYVSTTTVSGQRNLSVTNASMSTTASLGGGSFILYINNPTNTTAYKSIYGNGGYTMADGEHTFTIFGGFQKNTAALTGVRFLFASGNIATGTFKLYGIRG